MSGLYVEAIHEMFHGVQFDWSNEELLGNMINSTCVLLHLYCDVGI